MPREQPRAAHRMLTGGWAFVGTLVVVPALAGLVPGAKGLLFT